MKLFLAYYYYQVISTKLAVNCIGLYYLTLTANQLQNQLPEIDIGKSLATFIFVIALVLTVIDTTKFDLC